MSINLAVVGCGAISRSFYLPVLAKLGELFGKLWLVDPSDRALSEAGAILKASHVHRLGEINDDIHLAIVATPNSHHYALACEALCRGADVLLEKPFVIWPEEGDRLVQAAEARGRILAVNQTRRFFPVASELKRQVERGSFGKLQSIAHREGVKLSWPFESGAGFARGAIRTGAIMDFGVHVVDFYHYIFHPVWKLETATHDGFDGPEGLADLRLRADDAPVFIRLSRYHEQTNTAVMTFEHAEVTLGATTYCIRWSSGQFQMVDCVGANSNERASQSIPERLLSNFLAAHHGTQAPLCPARDSMPVIRLLDEVYRNAKCFPEQVGAV